MKDIDSKAPLMSAGEINDINSTSLDHKSTPVLKEKGLRSAGKSVAGQGVSEVRQEEVLEFPDSSKSIDDLQIGAKLRHARLVQKLRLKDLAGKIGCSESLLSKVENDQVRPSLKILHRLAAELNMSIGVLFSGADDRDKIVMRRDERPIIRTNAVGRPATSGVRLECLVPDPSNRLLFGSVHVVEPGAGSVGLIDHKGEEIGYVLEGELELTVGGVKYHLNPGDSFFFDSTLPHGYTNPGKVTTRVVWINTPSTF